MKKIIFGLAGLALILSVGSAKAARARVPSNLCLDYSGFSDIDVLGVKSGASIRTAAGVVKQYSVQGNHNASGYSFPVSGSGYVAPGTVIFHAVFTGARSSGALRQSWFLELFYDLILNTGSIFYHFDNSDGSKSSGTVTVDGVGCTTAPLPGLVVGTPEKSLGE